MKRLSDITTGSNNNNNNDQKNLEKSILKVPYNLDKSNNLAREPLKEKT